MTKGTRRRLRAALLAALLLAGCRATDPAGDLLAAHAAEDPVARPEPLEGETLGAEALDPVIAEAMADGWPDASRFLSRKFGFLPIPILITEPAVGWGVGGALAFISEPLGGEKGGFGRPDITMVGGFGTQNGSGGYLAGDIRHWLDDSVQTLAFAMKSHINLDYYGTGDGLRGGPIRYEIEPTGAYVQGKTRIAGSRWWGGVGYGMMDMRVSVDAPAAAPGAPDFDAHFRMAGLNPAITYDSRDNIFTPLSGAYVEAGCAFFDPALGSDLTFQRPRLLGIGYVPLAKEWFLGVRGQVNSATGEAPFFLDPYVDLRGVPKFRFQGETAADLEAEVRWQFWNRVSLVGFGGVGSAWNDHGAFEDARAVAAGGVGVRYELARAYGIHLGVDVAFRAGETTLYIQIGSAWARP